MYTTDAVDWSISLIPVWTVLNRFYANLEHIFLPILVENSLSVVLVSVHHVTTSSGAASASLAGKAAISHISGRRKGERANEGGIRKLGP